MKKSMLFLMLSVIAISCAVHNVPITESPNLKIPSYITVAYVDINGNFYPDQWEQKIGTVGRKSSLYLTAVNNGKLDELTQFEAKKLAEIKTETANKKRVFILIHGYNNDAAVAKLNYANLENKIPIDPANDQVIEFYWDGLVSHDPAGSAKIWFNATGYSQMAGEFALRKILNQINNMDVILISHSRGASVVLSAISNPPFDPDFWNATTDLGIPIGNKTPLRENGNRIVSMMLAPAVGEIDFTKEDDIDNYRSFSSQLKGIHITVNESDPVLKKFVGLQGRFNPTTLGHNLDAYTVLQAHYGLFTYNTFTGQKQHDFVKYVDNPEFLNMIKNYVP
jgi:hypothetical protein